MEDSPMKNRNDISPPTFGGEFLAALGMVVFVALVLYVLPMLFSAPMTDFGLLH
jgi:hypothetical protein